MNELADLDGLGGKIARHVARLAGIFHIMEHGTAAAEHKISGVTMESAIKAGRYYIEHSKATHRMAGADDEETELAKYVLGRIDDLNKMEFKKRELHLICRGKDTLNTIEGLNNVLALLISRGYIRISQTTGGGRPSEIVHVNPLYMAYRNSKKIS